MEGLSILLFFAIAIINLRDFVFGSYSFLTRTAGFSWTFHMLRLKVVMSQRIFIFFLILHFVMFIVFFEEAMNLVYS